MISIKINEVKYTIKTLADLSVKEYIELIEQDELDAVNLLAYQTGIPKAILLKAKIKADKHLNDLLFNVPILVNDPANKYQKTMFVLDNKAFEVSRIAGDEYGYHYVYDTFEANILPRYEMNELTEPIYKMCACLSTLLLDNRSFDLGEAKHYFDLMLDKKWLDVLPLAFFLQKRFLSRNPFGAKD